MEQTEGDLQAACFDRVYRGNRGGDRREVRHVAQHGLAAHRTAVASRLCALGRVDDESDVAVLQEVDDVRPPLAYLVNVLCLDSGALEHLASPLRGDDVETQVFQTASEIGSGGLVVFLHADEHLPFVGKLQVRGQQRLVERVGEVVGNPHDLSGGTHLGTEKRVDAGELGEREDRTP